MYTYFRHLILAVLVSPQQASGSQDDLRTAIDCFDVAKAEAALRAGADPNERHGPHTSITGLIVNKAVYRAFTTENLSVEGTRALEAQAIELLNLTKRFGGRIDTDPIILWGPINKGLPRLVEYLIKNGADPNGNVQWRGSALEFAYEYEHDDIIGLLLRLGAKPLPKDEILQIKLRNAITRDSCVEMERLIEDGASVNGLDFRGRTPLVEAIEGHCLPAITFLLERGANPNLPSETSMTPATPPICACLETARLPLQHGLSWSTGPKVLKILLAYGADVSAAQSDGKTALHLAAEYGSLEAVQILIRANARVMARDRSGKSPLDYAASGDIISALKNAGATER